MNKYASALLLAVTVSCAEATDLKYPVSEIPESLKADAVAIVRENKIIFTILSQSKARVTSLFAITIMNERGNKHATDVEFYNKFSRLVSFTAVVYDGTGKLIRKLKNNEISDQSSWDGFTLFSDYRYKLADIVQQTYPYTVVFEYEKEYKYLFHIDGFNVLPDEKVSACKASYELNYPPSLQPRFKTYNTDIVARKEIRPNGTESLIWNFENIKPIKLEPMGNGWFSVVPRIQGAPGHFEYDGFVGDMDTWNEFGKWISSLSKGRDIVPDATKAKIREMTVNLKTTEEKSKAVYQFLQNKTRYVGIQIGIGGYQPFDASVVDQTGYGDCKGLSNYVVALLKEAGVKANYVLINAGDSQTNPESDFPSPRFNHATVCIPNGKDSLWLECTSQTAPFGYQGKFTGDRKALIITEDGARIVNTLRYPAEKNQQSSTADVAIDKNGNARAKTKTLYSGLQYENGGLNAMIDRSHEDQKKWIQKNTDIPSFDVVSFSITGEKEKIPTATVLIDLSLNRFATVSGKRLFMTPNLLNRISFIPEKVEERKTEVYRKNAFTDFDTIRYSVPEELYPEFLPEPIAIQSRFGEYHANFSMDQGSVIYTRKIVMKKGIFPADSYNELIEFYKKINKADNTKLVFLNKT